ncbi:hypothetical protein IMG5_106310 [Ichthyophthirius multifiliis]|uniref:Uncharacterized protein n=1 Tax=Ichthyophthirius multifiliis TaxID=5932 RepID=G0QT54_ICHMU|nr:hypothetical protein IMG5_106310 [Ichthyophthirius multifiliis]EGR31579.1 hypothetical protein IMG5_106310 [Ichthyophthirius multifiliis]|eukprot:XP_004035065.1 hypothetical protein IMG5_106310 [Ichthyophthirius multifiliis]
MEKKQREKQEQEFKKEMEFMANKPEFTMQDYKQRILDQLVKLKKGLKAKFMSGTEETEAGLLKQKTILNAFYDDELLDFKKIKFYEKREIAAVTQCTIEEKKESLCQKIKMNLTIDLDRKDIFRTK